MAYQWPSSKASTTHLDNDRDSIGSARADLELVVNNQNKIIDMFNLNITEPANGKILVYNSTNDRFEIGDDSTGAAGTAGLHDIWVPAQAMYPTADGGCSSITTLEISEGAPEMRTLNFDKDSEEYAQFSIAMPKSWDEGTITATFYWTASAGSGTVSWYLEGVSLSNDDPINSAFGTAQGVTDTLIATNDVHITSTTSAITLAGSPAESDITFFQIYRHVSSDNLSDDAKLIGVKLHYTTDAENDA
tara:strand:+ start:4195 stop:4935 length:741 start_codon:yes stop_codon:yes gene_type:complete